MEHELKIKKLREGLFLLDEGGEATGYLLVGEKKACLIDTMNGYNDLKKATSELTDKPVMVINTHGHPDHIYGNMYFDKAYINPDDLDLAFSFINAPEVQEYIKREGIKVPSFESICDGDTVDLGGKTLKVYAVKGHTQGGILLLCPEERVLFTGDSINRHMWMQLDCCTTIEECAGNLEDLKFLMNEADFILHGHAQDFEDISLFEDDIIALKEIVAGDNSDDTEYNYFAGKALYHPLRKNRSEIPCGIVYLPENIR